MSNLSNTPFSELSFTRFLFHNRRNRTILYIAAAAIVIQFAVFKYFYPFANYINGDSYAYLNAAHDNSTIAIYPIGFSKFLRLVSVFAKPDLVLVSIQYLMIQCSTLFLLFSIFYFYQAGKVTQTILLCFMLFNPLLLHLGNMVSSDGLFLALSMTWFALLLWIVYKPSNTIIYWHAIVLFAVFTVRHNALFYPFISLMAFGLSKQPFRKKLTGLGLGLLLCGWFVALTLGQYKRLTGHLQYSAFSGWQWANNAMYAYRKVDSADREPVPPQFRALDRMVRNFHDKHPDLQLGGDGSMYMWKQQFPLVQYRESQFIKDPAATEFKKWASMGPLFSSYGKFIAQKYPVHFLRYFILPNSQRYFAPPVEFLGYYNTGLPIVGESAMKWFGYEDNKVYTRVKNGKASILLPYPYFVSISNLIMLLMLLSYVALKGWKYNTTFNKSILLAGAVWITNAGFTIFAAPAALRFQTFPALLIVTFSILLIDWMARLIQHLKRETQQQSLAI